MLNKQNRSCRCLASRRQKTDHYRTSETPQVQNTSSEELQAPGLEKPPGTVPNMELTLEFLVIYTVDTRSLNHCKRKKNSNENTERSSKFLKDIHAQGWKCILGEI